LFFIIKTGKLSGNITYKKGMMMLVIKGQNKISILMIIMAALLLGACAGSPTTSAGGGNVTAASDGVGSAGEIDQLFIQMMVPHHQGAVEMAKIAQERAEHPGVRAMADAIITAQAAEIDQMLGWMEAWYGTREVPDMSAMPMVTGMEDMGHGGHSTMDMAADVEALRNAPEPFDREFIDAMIVHHESAIDAANAVLQQNGRPELKELAEEIIAAQQREIEQMQAWRQSWYPE
jgi:uncharacterized protein (DUF305 family)